MNYLKFYGNKTINKLQPGGVFDDAGGLLIGQTLGTNVWDGRRFVDQDTFQLEGRNAAASFMSPNRLSADITLPTTRLQPDTSKLQMNNDGTLSGGKINYLNEKGEIVDSKQIGSTPSSTTKSGLSNRAAGALAGAAIGVVNAADNAAFGDKNFGAQSEAIDSVVHSASSALMNSGNPYAMAAGAALEGANFLTKMGGKTVDGFDVDINSSGYGQMGHKVSSSSRDFGAAIGLGGIFGRDRMARKLRERNEEAQMALKAADIADSVQFEQEARMNSVDDILEQNEIALNGGIDTSLLAAKQGAKLQRIQQLKRNTTPEEIIVDTPEEIIIDTIEESSQVLAAKNGAKLELVEVSEAPNVIPEGELHKNKHDLDLEGITKKGIPVGHLNTDDNPETLAEIKASGGEFILDAEIESEEVIFNKELTDYVEDARKKWHESNLKDTDLALEVGKRIVKELLMNTNDNTDLIPKMEEQL